MKSAFSNLPHNDNSSCLSLVYHVCSGPNSMIKPVANPWSVGRFATENCALSILLF